MSLWFENCVANGIVWLCFQEEVEPPTQPEPQAQPKAPAQPEPPVQPEPPALMAALPMVSHDGDFADDESEDEGFIDDDVFPDEEEPVVFRNLFQILSDS